MNQYRLIMNYFLVIVVLTTDNTQVTSNKLEEVIRVYTNYYIT